MEVGKLTELARHGLEELIAKFDDPVTPYHPLPRLEAASTRNDYEHLERVQEWLSSDSGEGE